MQRFRIEAARRRSATAAAARAAQSSRGRSQANLHKTSQSEPGNCPQTWLVAKNDKALRDSIKSPNFDWMSMFHLHDK